MIKKQIICCGAIFSFLILTKWTDSTSKEIIGTEQEHTYQPSRDVIPSLADVDPERKKAYLASLHFAHEHLPFGDQQIDLKMMRHLKKYSFQQIRSYHIHDQALKSLPVVEEILVSYGIPADFKYIPLVESGFTKNITSHKGASGYWQFMPATAQAFGLKVNDEVDERQDLIKSTHAAAKYIKVLYKEFDSWLLAAAAYNVGGGNLRKEINRQGEDNYFKLKLNRETSDYVYRLISVKEIIEHPTFHGYTDDRALLAMQANSSTQDLNDVYFPVTGGIL